LEVPLTPDPDESRSVGSKSDSPYLIAYQEVSELWKRKGIGDISTTCSGERGEYGGGLLADGDHCFVSMGYKLAIVAAVSASLYLIILRTTGLSRQHIQV
jgi:hypothetical protein